ncbi:hypothetical protein [uncultured Sulfitobacter sp.]|jgi:hypothetical protein|uniref:hypothetical protein n=1 Tax=Sulfitobacter sp. SH22 TaxID=3421172 RepID=UPI0025DF0212|nr:hypothetical protein [uncultured Sulfitobacter sp.]
MLAKLKAARLIYRDEARIDWVILAADAVGVAIVALAFANARIADQAPGVGIQIATALF